MLFEGLPIEACTILGYWTKNKNTGKQFFQAEKIGVLLIAQIKDPNSDAILFGTLIMGDQMIFKINEMAKQIATSKHPS